MTIKNQVAIASIVAIACIIGAVFVIKPAFSSNKEEDKATESVSANNPGTPKVEPVTKPEATEQPEEPEVKEPETVELEITNEDGTVEKHTITSDQLPLVGDSITNDGFKADFLSHENKIMGKHADGVLRSSSASMRRINSEISGFSDGITTRTGFDQTWADKGTIWSANAANEEPYTLEELKQLWKDRKAEIDALPEAEQIELYDWCIDDEIYNNIVFTDMVYQTIEPVEFFSLAENAATTITSFRARMNGYCDIEKREAAGLPVGKDAFMTYDSSKYSTTEEIMSHLEKTDECESDVLSALELFDYYTPVGIEKRTTSGVFHMVPTADDRVSFAVWTTDSKFQETDNFLVYQLKVKTDVGKELVLDEIGVNLRDKRIVRFAAKTTVTVSRSSTTQQNTVVTQDNEEQNHSSNDGGPGDNPNTQTEEGKDLQYSHKGGSNNAGNGSGGVSTESEQKYDQIQQEREEEAKKEDDALEKEVSDTGGGTTQNGPPVAGEGSDLNKGYNTGDSTGIIDAGTGESKGNASDQTSGENVGAP